MGRNWFLQIHSQATVGLLSTHQRDSCIVSALLKLHGCQPRRRCSPGIHRNVPEPVTGQLFLYGGINADQRNQEISAFPGHGGGGGVRGRPPRTQTDPRDTTSTLSAFLMELQIFVSRQQELVLAVISEISQV